MAAPLIAVASAAILSTAGADVISPLRRRQLFVVISTASWCALVQYPTDTYQYFLYALPLFVLAGLALRVARGSPDRAVGLSTLVAFIVLGFFLRPIFIAGGGSHVVLKNEPTATLDLPRGGLTVGRRERDEYVQLVSVIQQHSRSRYIFVSPDAPEVYFLGERENPTRTFFDFSDDQNGRTNRVLGTLRQHRVDVVVVNLRPRFSSPVSAALRDSLAAEYPHGIRVGQFEVLWQP